MANNDFETLIKTKKLGKWRTNKQFNINCMT